jgi:arylformamidase
MLAFANQDVWRYRRFIMNIDPVTDSLYDNRKAVPAHAEIMASWADRSTMARAQLGGHLDIAFGDDPLQTFDLFPARANRGLMVFIHGGYWRSRDKSEFSFIALPYADAGISTAFINYRLCPAVSIADIVDDCRNAIACIGDCAGDYGINIDPLVLVGHSAGAHLVAMMHTVDWAAAGVHPDLFAGSVALSGLYDLAPLLRTSVNAELQLDTAAAQAMSPIHLSPLLRAPIDMVVGADETAAFLQQTALLSPAWPGIANAGERVAGANHFTIVDHFADPASPAFQRSLTHFS